MIIVCTWFVTLNKYWKVYHFRHLLFWHLWLFTRSTKHLSKTSEPSHPSFARRSLMIWISNRLCRGEQGSLSSLVDLQGVRFNGSGRVIKCIRILSRFSLQLTLMVQGSCSTVAKESGEGTEKVITLVVAGATFSSFSNYRSCRMNSTSWPEWQVLMQLIQMAFLSVVLQVRHLIQDDIVK